MREQAAGREHQTRPLELFFDLVFVFAFTEVTTVFAEDATWRGLGRGFLILAAVWWAWSSYAWLTNSIDADDDAALPALLVATAAMFVAALAVPDAFGRHAVIFGVAFLIVAVVHLALYAASARTEPELLQAIVRLAPWSLAGASAIFAAGFVHGAARPALWIVALAVGFAGPVLIRNVEGWRIAPAHFVERHGLIVLIAVGESLVAIGLGARGANLNFEEVTAALLGLAVAIAFWLAYFDFFPIRVQQLLTERHGPARIALARDAYSYLHLPMITGIVLFAFAMKETLAHTGRDLHAVPAFALTFGPTFFLFAFVALRFRVSRQLRGGRLVAAIASAALFPVALHVPALVALTLVAAVWVALHAYELIGWRDTRAELRALRA